MDKTDKLILVCFIILIIVFCAWSCAEYNNERANESQENLYAIPASVTTIDDMRKRVGLTDSRQIEWYWYEGLDCKLGDMVLLVMNDHNTEYIFDDYIVNISEAELVFNAP